MKSLSDSGDVSSGHTDRVEEDIATVQDWDPLRSASQDSSTEKESGGLNLNQALEMEIAAQSVNQDVLTEVEEGDGVLRTRSSATVTAPHLRSGFKSALPPPRPWNNDASLHLLTQRKLGYSDSETASHRKFLSWVFTSLINWGQKRRMIFRNSRPLLPKSSYYFGPPPKNSAFGTLPSGQIGVHYPREMVRIERDYSGGELPQFAAIYPLELEGRVSFAYAPMTRD